MSLIDSNKGHLNSNLWANNELLPSVKAQILNPLWAKLKELKVSLGQVSGVYLVGSSASTRYRPDSDLDINVTIDMSEIKDAKKFIEALTSINGVLIKGTQHEINYYVLDVTRQMNMPNIYDVVNDEWVRNEQYPDVNVEIYRQYVKSKLQDVNNLIFELDADIIDYKDLVYDIDNKLEYSALVKLKLNEIENDLQQISNEYFDLVKSRKLAFTDVNLSNITYKYLEKYKLLQKMKKVYELLQDGYHAQDFVKESLKEGLSTQTFSSTGFKYLIHTAPDEDIDSILKNGFRLSSNPHILKGVYTIPDAYFSGAYKRGTILKLNINPNAKFYDTGCDRPMDCIRGFSEKKDFYNLWATVAASLNPKFEVLINNYSRGELDKLRDEAADLIMDDTPSRIEFQKRMLQHYLSEGIQIVQQGGEVVVIDLDAITKVIKTNSGIKSKLESLKKRYKKENIDVIQKAIQIVRKKYPNIPENHFCVEASKELLPVVQQFFPDAILDSREVVKPNGETLAKHFFIYSEKGDLIIDSQMAQFQNALDLKQDFVDKGIYRKAEFDNVIKDYYMSLNNF